MDRQFVAEQPDQLWVADFIYVSTLQGFAYVALIINVFAGCMLGWRVSPSMKTAFVLNALEQALRARRPSVTIHHSDKDAQYVSLAYTQWLKDAELLASTGSTGKSYENTMEERINGLYKAEIIHRKSRNTALKWGWPRFSAGGLVQQSSAAGKVGAYPTGRSRTGILCCHRE